MLITKTIRNNGKIYIHNKSVEKVQKYNYLGIIIYKNNDWYTEIKSRIEKVGATIKKVKNVLCGADPIL